MMATQPASIDSEVFWDCQDESLSYISLNGRDSPKDSGTSNESGSSSDSDDLQKDLQDFAFDELGETPEIRQKSLQELRTWLLAQKHLRLCFKEGSTFRLDEPGFDSDNFLLRFLRFKKFNVRKSAKMMDQYLAMRCHHPNWFMNLDPTDNSNMQELVDLGYVFALPDRDADGRRVIFNYAHVLDPSRHTSVDIMKTFIATFETLLCDPENQIRGFTYILYCKGLTLGHCSVWTPLDAATMFTSCEKNLPIRHRSINLMYLPLIMWAAFEFAKSFLSHKIKSRICTLSDDTKLVERFGFDMIPKEFGGKTPLAELTAAWKKELIQNKDRLASLDSLRVSKPSEVDDDDGDVLDEASNTGKERRGGFWSFIQGTGRS